MAEANVKQFGAAADGTANDAPAIQRAIDACAQAPRGGRVIVPPGTYRCGTLRLRSGVTLHLDAGATIQLSEHPEDYAAGRATLLEAGAAHDLALTGQGVIDGRDRLFMAGELPHIFQPGPFRPNVMQLVGCRGVRVEGITIRHAPHWTLHLAGCQDVAIEHVTILNDLKVPNNDGIDPDHCQNVTIRNCRIEAGDDCIVIKNTARFASHGPTRNIRVTDCTFISTSAAMKIGTESVADFEDIIFERCTVRRSNRAMAIQLRDAGNVRNVTFRDIDVQTRRFHDAWWGCGEAIHLSAIPRHQGAAVGRISNVRFERIRASGEGGAHMIGAIDDVTFDDVRIELLQRQSRWPGGTADHRPCAGQGVRAMPAHGIYADGVSGLALCNVQIIEGNPPLSQVGQALATHNVTRLTTTGDAPDETSIP